MNNPLLDTVTNNNIDTLIDPRTLQTRISELAKEITSDYHNKELLLVCILRGGVVFLTDLMRQIPTPHLIDFMIF